MGLFSTIKNHLSARNDENRLERGKHRNLPDRIDYLLNEDTLFEVTEAFRNVKASLSVSVPKKRGGVVIMASSAYPREGKTTCSVNLSLMFAQSDVKVIIVDADIRKGRVARFFKARTAPGLSDCLSGQCDLDKAIHLSHVHPNLSYITCGTHSPRPYELLESEEMKALLEELRKRYDYIIIDTPPIQLVSDALALADCVDGAVMICRHNVTYVNDLSRSLNKLEFSKIKILGIVVNDYKAPEVKKGGSANRYRYYNGYGYGDGNKSSVVVIKDEEAKE